MAEIVPEEDFSAFALDDIPYLVDVVTRLSRADVQSRVVDQAKRGLKRQVPVVIGVEVGPAPRRRVRRASPLSRLRSWCHPRC